MSSSAARILRIGHRLDATTGARRAVSAGRRVDQVNSAISVVATVATLLLCIGVSDDAVAQASPLAGQSRALGTPVAANSGKCTPLR